MEDAMGTATTTSTPVSQVDDLIKQVAEESGLEISAQLASVPSAAIGEASASAAAENPLEKRLAALRSWILEPTLSRFKVLKCLDFTNLSFCFSSQSVKIYRWAYFWKDKEYKN